MKQMAVTQGLRISKDLQLPIEAATWTFAVLSIKGWGKTYVSADLAEEMVKSEIPIVAIDGLGIWWGITVGTHNHKGLPVVVFGGAHKDLDLPLKQIDRIRQNVDEDKLRLMVKAILEARISVVLDTAGLSKGIQRRIVATFVNELTRLNANYGTRHVFIEESDLWCPQKGLMGGGDLALSAGAIDDLVRRGGNFNLGCTLITQRSAVLNKDVLTQASCLIVGRILHKIDKDAVKTWVQSMGDPKDPKIIKWYDELRDLKNGEGYVWHPEQPVIFRKVMFRERETLHSTREYFQQLKTTEIKPLDRSEFIAKFNAMFLPKPKLAPTPPAPVVQPEAPKIELRPVHLTPQEAHDPRAVVIARWPDESKVATPVLETVTEQTIPNWTLVKNRPTFQMPAEMLDSPPSALARVLVILTNHEGRDDRWTGAKIKKLIRDHAWPDQDIDQAIDQLIRAETLRKQSNNYLRFYRDRVQVREVSSQVQIE
jgi:hypothetical protein